MEMRADCPYQPELRRATGQSEALLRALRRLRRELRGCASCRRGAECRVQARFQAEVAATIEKLRKEWGLNE